MKPFGKLVVALFVLGLIILVAGLFFAPRERAALQDQQSPTGQIRAVPNAVESAPAAQPPEAPSNSQPASR